MNRYSHLPGPQNLSYLEHVYGEYARDPASVQPEWRAFFDALENGSVPPGAALPGLENSRKPGLCHDEIGLASLQDRVNQLVRNYRVRGHMIAQIDPLGRPRLSPEELNPAFFGFSEADLERNVTCETISLRGPVSIRRIFEHLRDTYCRTIGVEYMHIDDISVRRWLQARMESTENRARLGPDQQRRIVARLNDAVTFEEFVRRKFVGAKSFSLEGCESLIPLLDMAIERAGEEGVKEVVLGMAHRGRLNVLANILGKSPSRIFREFEDSDPELYRGRGDVKYHLGHSGNWTTSSGRKVHLTLSFNPSHLEFVDPVVMGRTRAKQDRILDTERSQAMALLIHGDASFAGEGVVQETLNLSQLPGYRVGGTLHIIVNNQIGFTTSTEEARSSVYATDVAKMLQIPIFHVNGEDPEAVAQVVNVALEFRAVFRRDVVIDMYGYRRLGHNETDEPSFTQPVLYRAIEKRKSVLEGYLEHLLRWGDLTREEADAIATRRREHLEAELSQARQADYRLPKEPQAGVWKEYVGGADEAVPEVTEELEKKRLQQLMRSLTTAPEAFRVHPKVERLLQARRAMAEEKRPLDWASAELLAMASLAADRYRIRLSGQDSGRGTFSQRHAILYDHEDGRHYIPLQHLTVEQAEVEIRNSPLSETGVLGFEYGYSLDTPDGLVLWEAQFGDFVNAAQVVIDQFISSGEDKWERLSGLVLLLPHGFEGMGPEHSSARLERFLNLAAEDNIQVVYPTTPAQYFHCLRRQVMRRFRKPLVVMTPKSLLRHPKAVSPLEDCLTGPFQRILGDRMADPAGVRRILLCSGKVYFDLEAHRQESSREDVAILRLEQLYPLAESALSKALDAYAADVPVLWVQEEPENMGAWRYLRARFGERLVGRPLSGIYRPSSASPATGSASSHRREQEELIRAAFGEP